MQLSRRQAISRSIYNKRKAIVTKKNNDYANDQDTLSNFKRVSTAAGALSIDPSKSGFDYAAFMILMKLDRMVNLHNRSKTPDNESIEDTVIDGENYFELALCLMEDEHNGQL